MDALSGRPADNGQRPVIVVSPDGRNQHERATSVLVVPLSTSVTRLGPAHLLLRMGGTGLSAESAAQADGVSAVSRDMLHQPQSGQRTLSHTQICQLAGLVRTAMGCLPG